ncbi:MAG: hypothetical protein U0271_06425 [Polyangiaceae bacterium]
MRRNRFLLSTIAFSTVLLHVAAARADQPAYFDSEAAMTAGSNMAVVHGAGAAWYNPAGLHDGNLNQFDLTGSAFVLRARDFSGVLQSELPSGRYDIGATAIDIQPIPAALVYQRKLTDTVTAALGVFVTESQAYDISGDLKRDEVFPSHDGPVHLEGRGDLSLQSQTYRIGPSFSIALSPRVRIGVSAYLYYAALRDSTILRVIYSDPDGLGEASTSFRRKLSTFGGQLAVAAQVEPIDRFFLGITVRSPVISFGQTGTIRQEISGFSTGSTYDGPDFALTESPTPENTEGALLEPLKGTIGVAYKGDSFWVGAEADATMPMSTGSLVAREKGGFNVRAGARFFFGGLYSLGFGLFTDRSTRELPTQVGGESTDYYGFASGFQWDTRYTILENDKPRTLTFSTSISSRYALGIAHVRGALYAPRDATFLEMNALYPLQYDTLFHAFTVELGAAMSF